MEEQREARRALDRRADRRAAEPDAQVAFLMAWAQWPGTARSAASAGRSLTMTSGIEKELPRPRRRDLGRAQRPSRAQAREELVLALEGGKLTSLAQSLVASVSLADLVITSEVA
jgi:hypothetical protein